MAPLRPLSSRLFPDAPHAALISGNTAPLTMDSIVVVPVIKGPQQEKLEPLPASFWETDSTPPHSTSSPVPPAFTSPFGSGKHFQENFPVTSSPIPARAIAEILQQVEEDDLGPISAASAMAGPFQGYAPAEPWVPMPPASASAIPLHAPPQESPNLPLAALPALPPLPAAPPASLASVLAAVVASSPLPLTLSPAPLFGSRPMAAPVPAAPSLPSTAPDELPFLVIPSVPVPEPALPTFLKDPSSSAKLPVPAGREELAAAQEMLFDINLAVSRRKAELEELDEKATAAREIIARAESAQITLDTLRAELDTARTTALTEQEKLHATVEELRAEASALTLQSEDLTGKIAALQEQESTLKTTTATLAQELAAEQAEQESVRTALERITRQLAEDQESWKRQEAEAAARLEALQADTGLAHDALQRLKDQLSGTHIRNEALLRTFTEQTDTVSGLEEKLAQLTATTAATETNLQDRAAELESVNQQLEERQQSIALTESENQARAAKLESRCQELEAAARKAAALLADSEKALAESLTRQQELDQACQQSKQQRAAWATEQVSLTENLAALKAEAAREAEALAQTRQELHVSKEALQVLKDGTSKAEQQHASRRAELEEELASLTTSHARAEQALAATRSRHEALLIKQDEALTELERRQEEMAALTVRATDLTAKLSAGETADAPALPTVTAEDKAALEKLRSETAALETAFLTKTRQQELLEKELQQTEANLSKLRQTLTEEHEALVSRQQQIQADAAAAETAALTSREAIQKEQTFQHDLANRHTAALNDLDAVKANVENLRREADELQTTIRQRNSQKESLAEELRRTQAALDALPSAGHDEPSSTAKPFTEAVQEKTVMDLIRLVDATDSAHAMICQAAPGGMTTSQFTLLRESVTGILKSLGVKEFGVAPGTEVDDNIRRQIQVVKNLNGNATPCIQTVLSSGFVLDPGNGQYTFLRKPEVIVSSEGV